MGRIAGTTYFKIDSDQLSLTGEIAVPLTTASRADVIGLDGSVDYKETFRAPFAKGTFKFQQDFPLDKLTSSSNMTVTVEFANGQVYVLREAWLSGDADYNGDEGTVALEFHGKSGFWQ